MSAPPRVAVLSYAMTAASTATKAKWLAQRCELTLIQPSRWPWYANEPRLEIPGARIIRLPVGLAGYHHLHFYHGLGAALQACRPNLFYYDQEPWSLSTLQGVRAATRVPCAIVGFTWQNILKRYPPPFGTIERWVHKRTTLILAGNREAAEILRLRGYKGTVRIAPQFGVDLGDYEPGPSSREALGLPPDGLVIGFVGRLVQEKGVATALNAIAEVPQTRLVLIGVGPMEGHLRNEAHALGIADRVHFLGGVPSQRVPDILRGIDALILPSLTTRLWKEQFGRVLVEAMAVGVPVIGSTSGEIPNVIDEAGLIFREGDVAHCAAAIRHLTSPATRSELAKRGLNRVRNHYTQERAAELCWDAWCEAFSAWNKARRRK